MRLRDGGKRNERQNTCSGLCPRFFERSLRACRRMEPQNRVTSINQYRFRRCINRVGVLPPGTYVFRIMDSDADRHIVQIFNKEETTIYATILAIPNTRLKVTDGAVITFRETPAGQPFALRAMFYPGRTGAKSLCIRRQEQLRSPRLPMRLS